MVKKTIKKKTAKKAVTKKTSKKVSKTTKKSNNKGILTLAAFVLVALFIIMNGAPVIEDGSIVKLHYIGTLEDGSVFDSSEGKDPLEFTVGDESIIKGFESRLLGLKKGDKKTLSIPSDEAYGAYNPELKAEYPKERLPEGAEPEVGAKMLLQSPSGIGIVTILEIKEEILVLDLNHPLAGKDLSFEIEIIEIK